MTQTATAVSSAVCWGPGKHLPSALDHRHQAIHDAWPLQQQMQEPMAAAHMQYSVAPADSSGVSSPGTPDQDQGLLGQPTANGGLFSSITPTANTSRPAAPSTFAHVPGQLVSCPGAAAVSTGGGSWMPLPQQQQQPQPLPAQAMPCPASEQQVLAPAGSGLLLMPHGAGSAPALTANSLRVSESQVSLIPLHSAPPSSGSHVGAAVTQSVSLPAPSTIGQGALLHLQMLGGSGALQQQQQLQAPSCLPQPTQQVLLPPGQYACPLYLPPQLPTPQQLLLQPLEAPQQQEAAPKRRQLVVQPSTDGVSATAANTLVLAPAAAADPWFNAGFSAGLLQALAQQQQLSAGLLMPAVPLVDATGTKITATAGAGQLPGAQQRGFGSCTSAQQLPQQTGASVASCNKGSTAVRVANATRKRRHNVLRNQPTSAHLAAPGEGTAAAGAAAVPAHAAAPSVASGAAGSSAGDIAGLLGVTTREQAAARLAGMTRAELFRFAAQALGTSSTPVLPAAPASAKAQHSLPAPETLDPAHLTNTSTVRVAGAERPGASAAAGQACNHQRMPETASDPVGDPSDMVIDDDTPFAAAAAAAGPPAPDLQEFYSQPMSPAQAASAARAAADAIAAAAAAAAAARVQTLVPTASQPGAATAAAAAATAATAAVRPEDPSSIPSAQPNFKPQVQAVHDCTGQQQQQQQQQQQHQQGNEGNRLLQHWWQQEHGPSAAAGTPAASQGVWSLQVQSYADLFQQWQEEEWF